MNVETRSSRDRCPVATAMLQWSHVLMNVETDGLALWRSALACFNGATSS